MGSLPPSSFGGARGNNRASEEAPSASVRRSFEVWCKMGRAWSTKL